MNHLSRISFLLGIQISVTFAGPASGQALPEASEPAPAAEEVPAEEPIEEPMGEGDASAETVEPEQHSSPDTTARTRKVEPVLPDPWEQCRKPETLKGTEGVYIVQFDQSNAQFIYPDYGPLDDDEIVLRICNTTPWKRYRLIFGSKTAGNDAISATTVGYAATEVDAALRGANALLANDHTCADPKVTGFVEASGTAVKNAKITNEATPHENLQTQCLNLRKQVAALVEVAKEVMTNRDQVATTMVECASRRTLKSKRQTASPNQVQLGCDLLFGDGAATYDGFDIGEEVNWLLKAKDIGQQIVWIDDTWHVVDLEGANLSPSLRSDPGEGILPPTIVGYLNTRAELITAIQRAMDGFSKLMALSHRIREDRAVRQTAFRLGRFSGNRIVVATLEEHTLRVAFTQDRKHLKFSTEVVPHQLSLTVEGTSFVQFDIGVAHSWLDAPEYGTAVRTFNGMATETVQKTSDGRELNPVLFASFLWCSQALSKPAISRSCRDGEQGFWFWAPRFALGLPLSADLGQGSAYLGLSLPYIPYVSVIGGLNARRVKELSRIDEGDPISSGEGIPTTTKLKWGPFLSVGVTEEIFHLLVPKVEAAK